MVLPGLYFQINLFRAQFFGEKKSSRVPHLFVTFVITETGRSVDMTYLRFKWAEMFNLLDVNHDETLDITDAELSTEYYIQVNNLTEEEVGKELVIVARIR